MHFNGALMVMLLSIELSCLFFFVTFKNDEIQCTTFSYQSKYSQWAKIYLFQIAWSFNFNFHCLIFKLNPNEFNKSADEHQSKSLNFFFFFTRSCWMLTSMFSDSKFDLPSPLDRDNECDIFSIFRRTTTAINMSQFFDLSSLYGSNCDFFMDGSSAIFICKFG